MTDQGKRRRLRSPDWWDDYKEPDMTALYLERYLNFGLTREELQSGRPIVGIAQTGSDLAPCNRHHLELANRVRDKMNLVPHEHVDDAIAVVAELAMKRAASYGRAPPVAPASWRWSARRWRPTTCC